MKKLLLSAAALLCSFGIASATTCSGSLDTNCTTAQGQSCQVYISAGSPLDGCYNPAPASPASLKLAGNPCNGPVDAQCTTTDSNGNVESCAAFISAGTQLDGCYNN